MSEENIFTTDKTYTFQGPEYVGEYIINNNFYVAFTNKPNWFHRTMTKMLLGWKWKDKK